MTGFATLRPRLIAVALLTAAGLACPPAAGMALAQDAAPQTAPAKAHKSRPQPAGPTPGGDAQTAAKDPSVAARFYTEGVKAYQAGKQAEAVQSMAAALGAGLASNLVPKALYYRGLAYAHLREPGLAISDLNSALYFKDGLDDAERAEARKQRSAAYHEAGLDEPAESGARVVAGSGSGEPSSTATVPNQSGFGDSFGNLFGGLFGGPSSPSPQSQPQAQPQAEPPSPATTAALLDGPHKVITPAGQETAEVLPWAKNGEATQSTAEPASPSAAPAAPPDTALPPPVRPAANAAKPKKGKFRIQVASVPSRDEASSVISNLQSKGEPLASAPVSVDPQKFGPNTFYRVRLGPYATAADTKAPCDALKAAGLDCLVTP